MLHLSDREKTAVYPLSRCGTTIPEAFSTKDGFASVLGIARNLLVEDHNVWNENCLGENLHSFLVFYGQAVRNGLTERDVARITPCIPNQEIFGI